MAMKTEQEQTKEMAEKMKRCFEKNGLLNFKWFAEALVQAGYGDVSEYKAEIERLRQEVRDTDKMARKTIEQYRAENEELENALKQSEDNYSRAYERLKAQGREIGKLKDENEALKNDLINSEGNLNHITTEIERLKEDYAKLQEQFAQYQMASDKEIRAQVKQAQIDVLNKLKKCSCCDNFFADGKWHRYVFVSDIDELIEEVQNGKDNG